MDFQPNLHTERLRETVKKTVDMTRRIAIKQEGEGTLHLYSLNVKTDNTVKVEIDQEHIYEGSLKEDWQLLAPKQISDPVESAEEEVAPSSEELGKRKRCQCRCIFAHRPGRLVPCIRCRCLVGPGCCGRGYPPGVTEVVCHLCQQEPVEDPREARRMKRSRWYLATGKSGSRSGRSAAS